MRESIEVEPLVAERRLSGVVDPNCPARALLERVTSRWGVLVLVALSDGTMRWGEIRRLLTGVTEKMLAQTLRTLEADGLVAREAHPVVPPRVDYSLTEQGRRAARLLLPLVDWAVATAVPPHGEQSQAR
ncbi:helix-turn-helix domain-containing protein [Catenulispora rubra]|uniref:winged helix-turn-helix transcriptional regulator n=1 Tax=Catenulispora rubra TaxID=280293 RepID=UPI002B27AAEA|nr:helix-turn-helix domain-containing protein [Catenulispora rubra]